MEENLSINYFAWILLEKLIKYPSLYGLKIEKTPSGITVIDAGFKCKGGLEAGRIITEICMGGCGNAKIIDKQYGISNISSIYVTSDHPVIATLGSQYAGWKIKRKNFLALGSGPARALRVKTEKIYQEINYKESFNKAVLVLESEYFPKIEIIESLTDFCKVKPKNFAVILTPTKSITGVIQVSGRILETGINKFRRLGLNLNLFSHGWGIAPIPPVHPEYMKTMARMNDAILYGGIAHYVVKFQNEEKLKEIIEKIPSHASLSYGKSFLEILEKANYDFYKIDPDVFAPAMIKVYNLKTGNTFESGKINFELLNKSFSS